MTYMTAGQDHADAIMDAVWLASGDKRTSFRAQQSSYWKYIICNIQLDFKNNVFLQTLHDIMTFG